MKGLKLKFLLLLFFVFSSHLDLKAWGFFGHKLINRLAIFSLPKEMFTFYKYHIDFITENAVHADKRRYAVDGEAPKHYIDLDVYGDSAFYHLPKYWDKAVEKYTKDTLCAYGILPWQIQIVKRNLTFAFLNKNVKLILKYSADLGHYLGDAHVPLHTTENYNGQKSNQYGIHGFWESRLPELYSEEYGLYAGKAIYINDTQNQAWGIIKHTNAALDSVLNFEKNLTLIFPEDKKYSFEQRGAVFMKVYSQEFSFAYHQMLGGQVERQMMSAVKEVSSFWFTAWVDAGQPDLSLLLENKNSEFLKELEEEQKREIEKESIPSRPHESYIYNPSGFGKFLCAGH